VATDATGKVGAKVEDQLIATYSPTLGASFDLPFNDGGTTRLGFTYRGALAARFDVTIDATKLSTLNIPVLNIAGMAQYDPPQTTFELARSKGALAFAVGATLKHWSSYPGPIEPTLPCPSTDQGCTALVPATITYKNTFVPRVGAEYAIEASKKMLLHVRAGAFYEPSPLPSKLPSSQAYSDAANKAVDVPTRYFDADRFVMTVGYGVAFRDPLPPLTIDLFAQAHVLVPRTIVSDAPNGATGPDNSVGRVSGTVLAAGLLVGVSF
jgi:long-chain fatty acid transport protein